MSIDGVVIFIDGVIVSIATRVTLKIKITILVLG